MLLHVARLRLKLYGTGRILDRVVLTHAYAKNVVNFSITIPAQKHISTLRKFWIASFAGV